jgi:hypothetical protein
MEQAFCKWFKIIKNNEKVYMQLWNIQQQIIERVEVYYERLLKLIDCLHVKATYVFLTTVFRVGLLPYLKLAIAAIERGTQGSYCSMWRKWTY